MKCSMLKVARCPTTSSSILQDACQHAFLGLYIEIVVVYGTNSCCVTNGKLLLCTLELNSTPQVCNSI